MSNSAAAFPAAADRDGASARRTGSIHACTVPHQHGVAGRHDLAAMTGRRRRLERALDDYLSGLHATHQGDAAAAVLDRIRFDDAGVVYHAREQRVLGACGHQDLPTVRPDHAAVVRQTVEHALVHLHMHQVVAGEGECGGAACAERHAAQLRADHALIARRVAEQRHIAAAACLDRAVVDDAARARAAEGFRIGAEGRVIQIESRGDQAADIDFGAAPEHNAVRIDEIHLSVGV